MTKIALCVPFHGDPKAAFTFNLAYLLATPRPADVELKVIAQGHSVLPEVRTNLVVEAIQWQADYLLLMDSDHTFPPDALARLLRHGLPFVGINYPRKTVPHHPTAVGLDDLIVYTTEEKARASEVEEVARVGLGLCLIDVRVFGALEGKAKAEGKPGPFPIFAVEYGPDGSIARTEDYFFCEKVRAAGVSIHVDHALSWECGHVGDTVFTNRDTMEHAARAAVLRRAKGA